MVITSEKRSINLQDFPNERARHERINVELYEVFSYLVSQSPRYARAVTERRLWLSQVKEKVNSETRGCSHLKEQTVSTRACPSNFVGHGLGDRPSCTIAPGTRANKIMKHGCREKKRRGERSGRGGRDDARRKAETR